MKKSVIALAVAMTMPVAQAETTITGSVMAKYYFSAELSAGQNERVADGLDVDSDLDISNTALLSNGMTTTASFDVGNEGNSGEISLQGDFGVLTVGSNLDYDSPMQFSDIAEVVGDPKKTITGPDGDDDVEANAIHYAGTFADGMLGIELQRNAVTDAAGLSLQNTIPNEGAAQDAATMVGVKAKLTDSLVIGYGYAKFKTVANHAYAYGVTYNMGDLDVSYGQGSNTDDTDIDGVLGVKYTFDQWSIKYTYDSAANVDAVDDTNGSGKNALSLTYTGDTGLSATLVYDQDEDGSESSEIDMELTYVTGDLTMKVSHEHDSSNDASFAYHMGNAELELARDDSKDNITLMYKVSF